MNAVDVSYDEDGARQARPLLLAGSLGSTRSLFEPLLPSLAAFHVIRYDHRGHGDSPVPDGPYTIADLGNDVLRLLDRIGVERASFGGVSLGGMVGMWLAANAPERVDRLVLVATSARLGPAEGWRERGAIVRRRGTAAVADAVVGRWFTPEFRRREPALVDRMRAMVAATPREGYAACCEAIATWDFEHELGKIRAPTLVVAGAMDEATPPPHARTIAERVERARLVVLEQAAHVPLAEHPRTLGALFEEHLASSTGEAA